MDDTSTPTINIPTICSNNTGKTPITTTWNNSITSSNATPHDIPLLSEQESKTPHVSTSHERHTATKEQLSTTSSPNDIENDYSFKDQSLGSIQSLTLDELKTMFSVKKETIITNIPTTDKQ